MAEARHKAPPFDGGARPDGGRVRAHNDVRVQDGNRLPDDLMDVSFVKNAAGHDFPFAETNLFMD